MATHDDWPRQWQSLLSLWNPAHWNPAAAFGNPASAFAASPAAPFAPLGAQAEADPYAAVAGAFSDAVRSAAEAAMSGPGEAGLKAAQQLSDFLRARFSDLSGFAAIGPLREHQQRWLRMLEGQQRADQARGTLTRLWSDALREAAEKFARRCLEPGHAATAPAKLYDEWIDCAEDAYARMAHGEAYCAAQAELVNALAIVRGELQAVLELWAKQLDLPTRTELNRLHRAVKSLGEELSSLRAAASAAPAGAAAKKPGRGARGARAARAARPRRTPRGS